MCGIAGFIDFNRKTPDDVLHKMTHIMQHRGPDGDGHYIDKTDQYIIGLGHRRLSIIDLSNAASQPMQFGNLQIIFNGEMYNYNEVRDELMGKGHQFATHSDTEVILHAYQEWGKQCLHKFVGMFAFVLYDAVNKTVFCARDRAGVKPFNWYFHEGLFLFGSELKAFHQHPDFKKELNAAAVAAFMQYGYVPTPHCIFNYSHKLQPGHTLTIDLTTQKISIEKYWDVLDHYNKPKLTISLPDAINETETILEKAFQYRMVADVPVGVFLSGGYDSTCVTALLQKNTSTKINTFTIGVHDKGLNEAPFAKETAAHLGTNHTEYYCTTKEALEIVPDLPFYYDEPFADSSAIPTTLVSRLARQQVTVAISADAGDEVFGGYNKYDYVTRVKNKLNKVPAPVRKGIASVMKQVPAHRIPYFNKKPLFTTRYKKIMHLLKDNSAKELLHNMSSLYFQDELNQLFRQKPGQLSSNFDNQLQPAFHDDLSYMMAIDYQTYMLDDILQKVDRASMCVSLEGREPFLDQHIIEFAAQLPSSYKLHNGIKKYILRQIVHKYVPQQMMERPKMGFGIPIASWLKNELKEFVDQSTDPAFIEQQGLFNPVEIKKLYSDFYNGKEQLHTKIWYLLMFQMWYKRWM
ncbi:asparagine synthase (glutamine-hydrolyzing) [Chitinophagaceae bacterium IBVUCB2]|nr:asparagine synthase (glutamine-hydrolyzing) [Chitinophagaceae bacterium IBVUCB2]